MTKVTKILLVVILMSIPAVNQTHQEYWNIGYPSYIPSNSSFDISIVTSKIFSDAESLEIYFTVDNNIEIKSSELKSGLVKKKISISEEEYPGVYETVFKLVVDLKDTLIKSGEYFQLLTTFKNENSSKSEIKVAGIFKRGEEILAFCKSDDEEIYQQQNEPYFCEINLDFYKPQKYAGRSLQLNNGSFLELNIPASEVNFLTVEFWLKINNFDLELVSLEYKNSHNKIFELKYNLFAMLYVENLYSQPEFTKPVYSGKKLWNRITILVDKSEGRFRTFCNDMLISTGNLLKRNLNEDLILKFGNQSENKSFQIEQLRVIESVLEQNQYELNSNSKINKENISNLLSVTFDNSEELTNLLQKRLIEFGGIQLVKSDAPVFTPSPELNIEVFRNSYELSWQSGGGNIASEYILEKSSSNLFEELVRIQSTEDKEKTYSYTDGINESAGIIYYRIKQINKDGSVVYSSTVKVGQGKIDDPVIVEQNFPNPFNPKTSIILEITEPTEVEINIYSLEGREIMTLHKGLLEKGQHRFNFDGTELPSGIYLYKVQTPSFSQTRKMILAK